MVKPILSNYAHPLKGNEYQTGHESLCAKLQQAHTIAELVSDYDLTDRQMYDLLRNLADVLDKASRQCESLTPKDFDPDSTS